METHDIETERKEYAGKTNEDYPWVGDHRDLKRQTRIQGRRELREQNESRPIQLTDQEDLDRPKRVQGRRELRENSESSIARPIQLAVQGDLDRPKRAQGRRELREQKDATRVRPGELMDHDQEQPAGEKERRESRDKI